MRCWWDQPRCKLFGVNVGADEARRDLTGDLRINRNNMVVGYSPSNLFNEPSLHEFIEQLGLRVMQPPHVTGNYTSGAVDMARRDSQKMHPRTTGPDSGVHVARRRGQACDLWTWWKNGKGERSATRTASKSIKNLETLISISHTFNTFLFRPLSYPHHSSAAPLRYLEFEECSSKYSRHVIRPERVCLG